MKLKDIFESIIKPIDQSFDKNSDVFKSEQYFFAVNAYKAYKKAGSNEKDVEKFRNQLKDARAIKAFNIMVASGKHFLTDEDRKAVGL